VTIDGTRSRRRRLLVGGTSLWAVVVIAAALCAVWTGGTTLRAQTMIAQALPTVDTAVADLVTAGDGPTAVAAIGGYTRTDDDCRITLIRHGQRYEREVRFFTTPGTEDALLDRIVAGLPARYRAQLNHRLAGTPLSADAGNYVSIVGGTVAPGQVRLVADTGCRPSAGAVPGAEPAQGVGPAQAVLSVLGLPQAQWRGYRVPCAGGGAVWTIEAEGPAGSAPNSLVEALHAAPPGVLGDPAPVVARPELYAYRSGATGIAVRARNGAVLVTATTGCAR